MLQGGGWIGDAAADEPDQVVGGEAVAAIQDGQRGPRTANSAMTCVTGSIDRPDAQKTVKEWGWGMGRMSMLEA
jgi:hypothetical protein